jgi:hypothetical protein
MSSDPSILPIIFSEGILTDQVLNKWSTLIDDSNLILKHIHFQEAHGSGLLEDNSKLALVSLVNRIIEKQHSSIQKIQFVNFLPFHETLFQVFQMIIQSCPELKSVRLSMCKLDSFQLSEMFQLMNNVEELLVEDMRIKGDYGTLFAEFIANTKCLRVLGLKAPKVTRQIEFDHIFQSLKQNTTVKTLSLHLGSMNWSMLGDALQVNTSLENLIISSFHDEGLGILWAGIGRNRSLQYLNISGVEISREISQDISNAIKTNSSLRKLKLTGEYAFILEDLGEALLDPNCNISKIIVMFSKMNYASSKMNQFAESLGSNRKLKSLCLRANRCLSDESFIRTLANSISKNCTLEELAFDCFAMKGFDSLCAALSRNSALTSFSVSFYPPFPSLHHIAEVIEANNTLTSLDLSKNFMNVLVQKQLIKALSRNSSLFYVSADFGFSYLEAEIVEMLTCSRNICTLKGRDSSKSLEANSIILQDSEDTTHGFSFFNLLLGLRKQFFHFFFLFFRNSFKSKSMSSVPRMFF